MSNNASHKASPALRPFFLTALPCKTIYLSFWCFRISGFAYRGSFSAQRGSAAQRADRRCPPDAQQCPPQPNGHWGRPGGLEPTGVGPRAGECLSQVTHKNWYSREENSATSESFNTYMSLWHFVCRRQVNWREAKGEEEINIYQSERRRRTIHSLPKESRVS